MSAYEFNLSRYAERLEAGGVPREQALVHAELTAEILRTLLTQDQLQEALAAQEARLKEFFRTEIRCERSDIGGEISGIRGEISSVEARMDVKFVELKAYLAESQLSLVKWLFVAFSTQAAFIIAFLKLFP
jgi:hypothetical protein